MPATWKWILNGAQRVGIPTVVLLILLYMWNTTMKQNSKAIENNTTAMITLTDKLDKDGTIKEMHFRTIEEGIAEILRRGNR